MTSLHSPESLVASGAGVVGLQSVPLPDLLPGTLLIRPVRVGLCGTDLEIIAGTIDPAFIAYPVVLGHEWSGIVEQIASDVATEVAVGDLVVVEGIIPCGHCARCREGATNLCETAYDEIGFTRDGAAGPLLRAPAELVHRVNPAVGADVAALVEPASVVYRALRRAHLRPATKVLVIGAGTIGLLAVHLVSLWSPSSITVLDRRSEQGELAALAGATRYVIDAEELDSDYDIVIEAAGAVPTVLAAVSQVKRGGTIVLLGYPGDGVTAPIAIDDLINNDLSVIGSFAYTSAIWREVVGLLNAGRLNLDFLVTHRFPLEQWDRAIDALSNASEARAKVMLSLE
jgi:2-desacetyl-2-hydroxyethyl bacteriochlorophyllide A dehydrogenase